LGVGCPQTSPNLPNRESDTHTHTHTHTHACTHTHTQAGLILTEDIIIDAKSGVSGAGRSPKESNLYTEIAEV
jgi:N-acetyl-gamma-glutamylphosphate reductase